MRILRRYGEIHAVWDGPMAQSETLYTSAAEALDRLVYKPSACCCATWTNGRRDGSER